MKHRSRAIAALTAAVVAFAAAGCGGDDDATTDEPFKVGYLGPIAGPLAYLTQGDLAGLRTRVHEANEAGGVKGRKIEVEVRDDQGKPDVAATQYRQLVRDGAGVVTGMPISTIGETLLRDAEREKVSFVGWGMVTDSLMKSPVAFNTGWTPRQVVKAVEQFIADKQLGGSGPAKVAFVGSETAASKEAASVIAAHGKQSGAWEIVGEAFLPPTLTDVNPSLAPLARKNPDLVVQWTPSLPIIASAYKSQGLDDVPILAPFYTDEVQGAALKLKNYFYPQLFVAPGELEPIKQAAEDAGQAKAVDLPYFGFGYAAGSLIVAALEDCPDACNPEQFTETLAKTTAEVDGFTDQAFGFDSAESVAFSRGRWMHFDPENDQRATPVADWFDVS